MIVATSRLSSRTASEPCVAIADAGVPGWQVVSDADELEHAAHPKADATTATPESSTAVARIIDGD